MEGAYMGRKIEAEIKGHIQKVRCKCGKEDPAASSFVEEVYHAHISKNYSTKEFG
jgi:hypothetical protein